MNAFIAITAITYILYFGSFLGLLSPNTSQYIGIIQTYMQIYVSLFLVYRFNPFRTRAEFSELDKKIAFTAGIFLLMSGTIGIFMKKYLHINV